MWTLKNSKPTWTVRTNRESDINWGVQPSGPVRHDGGAVRVTDVPGAASTGIAFTSAEETGRQLGQRSDFLRAADTVLKFGKYRGQTLHAIAQTESGLLYLEWLLQQQLGKSENPVTLLQRMLKAYLSDARVVPVLIKAMHRKTVGRRQGQ